MPSENTTVTESRHVVDVPGANNAKPEAVASPISQPLPHVKPKVERVQSYLTVLSTSIGIIGAVGTGFVWVAANLFVGDLEIKPDKQVDAIVVKAVDKKGQQGVYYSNHVQLMPGVYHLEIGVPDKQPTRHVDVNVQLWKHTVIPYSVPAALAAAGASSDTSSGGTAQSDAADASTSGDATQHRRWWQFWRKKEATAGSETTAQ